MLERKAIYNIEMIRALVEPVMFEPIKNKSKVDLDGDLIKGNSDRFQTFFTKGIKCSCCGIEGKYFVKEKNKNDAAYHLNLYAIKDNGEEVLMTKDHIIPKSKGGMDNIDNYQTMCIDCNMTKGNNVN